MTPSALTPAARGIRKKTSGRAPSRAPGQAPTSAAGAKRAPARGPAVTPRAAKPKGRTATAAAGPRGTGHRSELRRPSAPRSPRRVSGPLGGLTRGRVITRPPRPAPRGRVKTGAWASTAGAPLLVRSLAYARALPDHSLLDRIIRGRAWIPLLGVLLAGIVAMQVEVLKLNAGIGRALDRGTALQSQNDLYRVSVAKLADDQRIESLAARMGMVMPAAAAIKFLAPGSAGNLQRALTGIHQPDPTTFVSQLVASGASPAATSGAAANTVTPTSTGGGGTAVASGVTSTATSTPTTTTTPATTATPPATGTNPTVAQSSPVTTTAQPSPTGTSPTPPAAGTPSTGQTGGSVSGSGGGVGVSAGPTATTPGG
jgi:hypothetical protein